MNKLIHFRNLDGKNNNIFTKRISDTVKVTHSLEMNTYRLTVRGDDSQDYLLPLTVTQFYGFLSVKEYNFLISRIRSINTDDTSVNKLNK